MKSTVVPAQVTTVEDRIAGNLTFNQMLLMTTPVFISGVIFAFLPPFMGLSGYKLLIAVSFAMVCLTLAIRIKGRIVLSWIAVVSKYNLRPRFYVFNKNDSHLRDRYTKEDETVTHRPTEFNAHKKLIKLNLPMKKVVWAEQVVANPEAKLEFKTTRKGDLRVYIQEIK